MPKVVLGLSFALFLVSAVLEGIITLAVFQALESMNPRFIRNPSAGKSKALGLLALGAVALVGSSKQASKIGINK